MQIILDVVNTLVETIRTSNIFISIFLSLGIIILESIFPILPLALFIATNVLVFGNIFGFILSWVGTIMGCILSFMAFRKGFSKYLYRYIDTKEIVSELDSNVTEIKALKNSNNKAIVWQYENDISGNFYGVNYEKDIIFNFYIIWNVI